jgi:hypothetical protein
VCEPFTSRWTRRRIEAALAAVITAITPSEAIRLVSLNAAARSFADRSRRCRGTLSASGTNNKTVKTGTAQRAAVKTPALAWPETNEAGRVAYSAAADNTANVGHTGDSPNSSLDASGKWCDPE